MRLIPLLALAVLLGSCVVPVHQECSPNQSYSCSASCGLAAVGQQVCNANGTSLSSCVCSCPAGFGPNSRGDCMPVCDIDYRWTAGNVCNPAAPGNITLLWNFAGMSCAQAGVASVQVELYSYRGLESLSNSGVYPCNFGGTDGVTLQNFNGGEYTFALNGLDAYGHSVYGLEGGLTVDGSISLTAGMVH